MSKARLGEQEFNDPAERVAAILHAQRRSRAAREAGAERRMEELALIAAGGAPPAADR